MERELAAAVDTIIASLTAAQREMGCARAALLVSHRRAALRQEVFRVGS
jgi:hypothetical protein